MNVAVFGGSGFLGSHVADALSARGHAVTIFDQRLSPYLLPGQHMVIGNTLDTSAVAQAAWERMWSIILPGLPI